MIFLGKLIIIQIDLESVNLARCWTEKDAIIFLVDMLGILDYVHQQKIIVIGAAIFTLNALVYLVISDRG